MKLNTYRKSRFIKELSPELLERGRTLELKRGQYLFRKGEKPEGFVYILQGLVGLVDISSSGNEVMLRVFGEHYFTGHRSILAGEEYHGSGVVLKKAEVVFFPVAQLRELPKFSEELFFHLVQTCALELRIAEEKFNDLSGKTVLGRIVESLIFLQNRHPGYAWTRKEIGEFCGAQTETVTRALTKMENEGLIKREGRDIHIVDEYQLLSFAEDC